MLEKLQRWIDGNTVTRTLDIKMNSQGTTIYAYDFKYFDGVFITEDMDLDRLDLILSERSEKALKEQYETLKQRFEYNKEGV
jgi:hypothetical protein